MCKEGWSSAKQTQAVLEAIGPKAAGAPAEDPVQNAMREMDARAINKPKNFTSEVKDWPRWRFGFTNYLSFVHANFPDQLELRRATNLEPSVGSEDFELSRHLFAILVGFLQDGKASVMAMALAKSRNGYRLWHQLCKEFEPVTASRSLVLLQGLMSPDFSSEAEFYDKLLLWGQKIQDYRGQWESSRPRDAHGYLVKACSCQSQRSHQLACQ